MIDIFTHSIQSTIGWENWGILCGIFFYTGATKGGLGNGLTSLTIIFLSLVIDPLLAIGLALVVFMVCDVFAMYVWWQQWERKIAIFSLRWGAVGIGFGVLFLTPIQLGLIPIAVLKILLAILGIYLTVSWVYSIYIQKKSHRPMSAGMQKTLCVLSGFTSTTLNAGGITYVAFMVNLGKNRHITHATTVLVFTIYNIMKLPAYLGLGVLDINRIILGISFTPILCLGIFIGKKIHAYIPTHIFNTLAYMGVTISSLKIMYDMIL